MFKILKGIWDIYVSPFLVHWVYLAIITGLLLSGYFLYSYYKNQAVIPSTLYKTLTQIKTITKFKYKTLYGNKIKYIPKTEYKTVTKTVLPDWLANSKNSKILAVGNVPPYQGTTQVVSTLNTSSGVSNLSFRQLPYTPLRKPFISIPNKLFVGGGYGLFTYKGGTIPSGFITAGDKLLKVGNVVIKAKDVLYINSSNTTNFVGVEATISFK